MKISRSTLGLVITLPTSALAFHQEAGRVINLSIYRNNFALVSEKRQVHLDAGHQKMVVADISKLLDPSSVLFDWFGTPNKPTISATAYDLGIVNMNQVVSRLNGQQVQMLWPSSNGRPGQAIKGRLEATPNGDNYILRTKDQMYISPNGTLVAPADTDVSTLPLLSVQCDSPADQTATLSMSYLTGGMSWTADYVARLQPTSNLMEIQCWATVNNRTGIPFPTAQLTLMAGSPNGSITTWQDSGVRVMPDECQPTFGLAKPVGGITVNLNSNTVMGGSSNHGTVTLNAPRMTVGETYAYKIPSIVSIGQDQMNRVSVLGTRTVPIKRDYEIELPYLSDSGFSNNGEPNSHIQASLDVRFENTGASNLGIPLPLGTVRVYERARDGQDRFIGAAEIPDTPKKDKVSLSLAKAFDIYGSCRVLSSKKISKHVLRKSFEIRVHNEKDTSATVRVDLSYNSAGKPVFQSVPCTLLNPDVAEWKITLKAGDSKTINVVADVRA